MPERGEVHLIAQRFSSHYPSGTRLLAIGVYDEGRYPCPVPANAFPLTISSVTTRGKNMFVHFTNNHSLHIHFGMTAGFRLSHHPKSKFRFQFNTGPSYYWIAVRKLRTEKVVYSQTNEVPELPGYDILLDTPTDDEVWAARPKLGQRVEAFLRKQGPFLGIGNYLKSMILYRAGVSPYRNTRDMSRPEFVSLFLIAKEIVREVVANGGHTVHDFLLDDGLPLPEFDVFPYRGESDRDGNEVVRVEITKNCATYWVPAVQK